MWRGIFTDLLTAVGMFVVAFFIGRGMWPSKYRAMKRRWADARAEAKHLRAQLESLQRELPPQHGDDMWDSGGDEDQRQSP